MDRTVDETRTTNAGETPKIGKLEMDGILSEARHDGHSPTFLLFASEKIPFLNENGKFDKVTFVFEQPLQFCVTLVRNSR